MSVNVFEPASDPVLDANRKEGHAFLFPSKRSVVHSTGGMVACSQTLAGRCGIKVLEKGGNAAVSYRVPLLSQVNLLIWKQDAAVAVGEFRLPSRYSVKGEDVVARMCANTCSRRP